MSRIALYFRTAGVLVQYNIANAESFVTKLLHKDATSLCDGYFEELESQQQKNC